MRLVKRQELMSLPEGTVYSHWKPCYSTGLMVKGETCPNDWLYVSLVPQPNTGNPDNEGDNPYQPILHDENWFGRDGMYDDDQLYAVYEEADLDTLARLLGMTRCKTSSAK